jgi:hypothetical protein
MYKSVQEYLTLNIWVSMGVGIAFYKIVALMGCK